ncbi:MAG: DNA mismatch repair protein MutS, partial [Myxococcota bacterium]
LRKNHPCGKERWRLGDFYEAFYEDAEACAQMLDITLTARSKERDIPMAGVPHHAIDGYLARLVDQGQTVVIVDQVEDPKQAKGLVRREVTRVLSPGTFVDPNAPPRSACYLVALAASKKRKRPGWGLAALDLSTGEFRATEGEDEDGLIDELARLSTKEVLFRSKGLEALIEAIGQVLPSVTRTEVSSSDYAAADGRRRIEKHCGASEIRGLKTVLGDAALDAAGLALMYAEATQIHPDAPDLKGAASLSHIEPLRAYTSGQGLRLDVQAREHLELFITQGEASRKGSLLHAIDAASTPMGGRLLARWLAYPLSDLDAIRGRQDAVAALVAAPSKLDEARQVLKGMGDLERLLARVTLGRAHPRDLSGLRAILERAPAALAAVQGAVSDAAPSARLIELAATDPSQATCELLQRALVDDPSTDVNSPEVFRLGYDETLDRHAALSKDGKQLIAQLEASEREKTGIPTLRIKYNKVFGYYLDVTKTHLKLVPDRYIRKQTTVNSERYFTEELKDLETDVLNAEDLRVARSGALFAELMAKVVAEATPLRALAHALAEIDVLVGFAQLAEQRGWIRPEVGEASLLEIVDGRHPVVELVSDALGQRFVPNDLRLDDNERLMIITGPNMAGKSTIMRQTALIVILAHMGAFVPAREARIPRTDQIFTRVGA